MNSLSAEEVLMGKVQIDEWAWDLIVEHYATIGDPSPDDTKVMRYILDKESRRMARDAYSASVRLDKYSVKTAK